ncbi:hypothetical protein SNEBB_000450 [Seison nebaliae]|nr:hypothetical protein SNEBB_000450 [Seison nebaliae]
MEDRDASQQLISPNSATTIAMITALEMASKENGQGEKVVPKKNDQTEHNEDAINDADKLKKSTRGRTKSKNQSSNPDTRSSFVIDPSVQVPSTTLIERLETLGKEYTIGLNRIAEINDKLQHIFDAVIGMRDEITGLKKQLGNNECEQRALGVLVNDLNAGVPSQSNTIENEKEVKRLLKC